MTKAAPENCYVLSGHSADNSVTGVGMYKFTGTLAAHKAYVVLGGGAAGAPVRMCFIFNQEQTITAIEQTQNATCESRKVLRNGQLVIIRNGAEYNVIGQTIK